MIKAESHAGRKPKPSLAIAVDCGSLSPIDKQEKAGLATVVQNLLAQLSRIDKRNFYLLYSFNPLEKSLLSKFGKRAKNRVLPRLGFKSVWLPLVVQLDKPNVFLASSQAAPSINTPTLGFVYDLAFLKYPKMYKNYQKLKANTEKLVKSARHIVTISESSYEDLVKEFSLDHKRVSVYYPGVSAIFSRSGPKYMDNRPYFLYVGVIKKTKNIEKILEAFAQFLKTNNNFRFIFVGNRKEQDEGLKKTISKYNLRKSISFKGYVPTSDLPKYYRGAVAFISLAVYEGFGLPIIEAMASGVPVIAAKNSSMPEIVGKAGILVNQSNATEISRAMESVTIDETLRRKLSRLGLKQARNYSWPRFARGILNSVYKYCNT